MMIFQGTIENIIPVGGCVYLIVDGRDFVGDNSQFIRSLDACFGGVIQNDHTFNPDAVIGEEIVFGVEDWGGVAWFLPVCDYDGPEIPPDGLVEGNIEN